MRPFLRETTPIIRDQLRPFSRAALPVVKDLRPAAQNLSALTPDLTTVFRVANYIVNELAYNPPGDSEEGFLFWSSWASHAGSSIFSTQDANSVIRRGLILASCSSLDLLQQIASANPALQLVVGLTNLPDSRPPDAGVCPTQSSLLLGMQKQAPSVGRILIMVAFALSCFGLLLFLWLAFGGSIPLKPKGYEVKVPFKEATSLANEADVRISGVPVGRVKTVKLERTGSTWRRSSSTPSTRRCPRTRGRSCARRPCSARPTSS